VEAYRHVAGLPVSDSRENLLVEMLSLELMPPDDEPKLTPEQIEVIRSWIDAGAHSRAGAPTELLGTLAPKLVTARKAFEVLEHKLGQLPETLREDARKAIEQSPDQRDEIQKYLVEKLFGFLFVNPAELPSLFPEFKEKATPLQEKIASLEAERKSLPKIRGLTDTTAVPNRAAGLSWPKGALAGPPCSIAKI
jgi:hypothetical protein